jgi:Ca2+-binding EF-hand superfamily protein
MAENHEMVDQDKVKQEELKNMEEEKKKYGEFDELYERVRVGTDTLNRDKLRMAVRQYSENHKESSDNLDEMINQIEINEQRGVSKEEFRMLMAQFTSNKEPLEELIDVYKIFDKNLSGEIGHNEITHVFSNLGMNLSEEDAKRLVEEADHDKDTTIDFEEFVRIMISK